MAATTYQSPIIGNNAQRLVAEAKAAELLEHLVQNHAANAGPYNNIQLTSINTIAGPRLEIILTNPLAPDQIGRYNLTQTAGLH